MQFLASEVESARSLETRDDWPPSLTLVVLAVGVALAWFAVQAKQEHSLTHANWLSSAKVELNSRFTTLASRYDEVRIEVVQSASLADANATLRSAFITRLDTAKNLQQLDEADNPTAESALVMQANKDLENFASSLATTRSGVVAH